MLQLVFLCTRQTITRALLSHCCLFVQLQLTAGVFSASYLRPSQSIYIPQDHHSALIVEVEPPRMYNF